MTKVLRLACALVVMMFAATGLVAAEQITYNSAKYNVLGENLFTNGSFESGVDGWYTTGYTTPADAANFTLTATGGFDGGAFITTSAAGASAATSIRQSIAVTAGKTYYFCVYTNGSAPSSSNYNYNALFQMKDNATEDGVLKAFTYGDGTTWNKCEFVFTAEESHPYVGVRMSWNGNAQWDGFQLYEIEEAGIDLSALNTEIKTAEDLLATFEEGTAWYSSLSDAITTAKNATPATAEEAASAVDALQKAESAASAALAAANAPLADGDYLIQNVETGYFFGGGNDWGTHASLLGKPQYITMTLKDGGYTLDSHQYNNATSHYLTTALYVDGGETVWNVAKTDTEGVFTIENGGNYLAGNGKNATLKTVTDATAAAAQWRFVTKADVIASQAGATPSAPVDVTALIQNPEFKRNANTSFYPTWTVTGADGTGTPSNLAFGSGGNSANCAESYHASNGFILSQEVTGLKAGVYCLSAHAFYRQDGSDNDNLPYVFANDEKSLFPLRTGSENSMAEAYQSFLAGNYAIEPIYLAVEEGGSINLGVKSEINASIWNIWGEFGLTYYGNASVAEVVLAAFVNDYNSAMDAAKAYQSVEMSEEDKTTLNNAITDNTVDIATATQESLTTATGNLNAAAAAAAAAAKKYENYKIATERIAEGNNDLTELIVNPSFEDGNINGWTSKDGGAAANNGNFGLANGSWFAERWTWSGSASNVLSDGSLSQTINGLPNGRYTVTAKLQNLQQGDANVVTGGYYLFANGDSTEVSAADTYTVITEVTNGTLTIGAAISGCTGNWVCVDDFTLAYTPKQIAPITVTPAEGEVTSLKDFVLTFGEGGYIMPSAKDGKNVVLATKTATIATIDQDQLSQADETWFDAEMNMVAVKFSLAEEVTEAGEYTLIIPAGAFYVGEDMDENAELMVTYTIAAAPVSLAVTVTPAAGEVEKLESFTFRYGEDKGMITTSWTESLTVTDADGNVVATITQDDLDANMQYDGEDYWTAIPYETTVTLAEPITASGTYYLNIPAGAFCVGEGYDNCDAATIEYTVVAPAQLINTVVATYESYSDEYPNYVDEDWGLVEGCEITLEAYSDSTVVIKGWMNQEGYDLSLNFDKSGTVVLVDGYEPNSNFNAWAYTGPNPDSDWDYYAYIYFGYDGEYTYSYLIGNSLYLYLYYDGDYRNYYLTWEGDIFEPTPDAITGVKVEKNATGMYDLQGRKLTAKPNKGMYIVNGKKVVVK